MAFRFEIDHVEHDGTLIATFRPLALTWTYQLSQFGPGSIYYEIPWSDAGMTTDGWAAKRTDWILYAVAIPDGTRWPLMGGIHDPQGVNPGRAQTVACTGLDWTAWLDNPYPWDYSESLDDKMGDTTRNLDETWWKRWAAANNDSLEDVVAGLLDPLSQDESTQIVLVPTFIGTAWLQDTDYTVAFADGTSTRQHLNALAAMADPRGFDMRVEYDKTFFLTGPRTADPADLNDIYSLTGPSNGIVMPDWANKGPVAANSVAIASGVGNTRRYSEKTYAPTTSAYRDWTVVRQLNRATSDLTDDDGISDMAEGGGYQDRHPQKELRLTIRPEVVDPSDELAMFYNHVGESINVDYTFPAYHRVDASFYITSQRFYSDEAGNWLCDLTLDQVY